MNETKNMIENEPKKAAIVQDQFKSTKKWNEIIDSFCGNMPLKRHWRNFKTFSDCFTASEAIDWIYRYLKSNPNFQHVNVTRQNAIKLLKIFLKERIIEDVRAGDNFAFKEFQDDDRIYKFCPNNPSYMKRTSNQTSITTSILSTSNSTTFSNGTIVSKTDIQFKNLENNNEDLDSKKENFNNNQNDNKLTLTDNTKHQFINQNLKKESSLLEIKIDHDFWKKSTKRMLESVLQKAFINEVIKNDHKIKKPSQQTSESLSPKSTSTLKRSTDHRIGLSKILDKKSYDILINISGANIEHNCNNINKHGVVINTNDDLPIWIVRAMHTLLNWDADNEQDYPKFYDVYQEIVDFFNASEEPLLTFDLSYIFVQIFKLLILKPGHGKSKNFNQTDLNHDPIDDFINSLKTKLDNLTTNDTKKNKCSTHKIIDKIASASNAILNNKNLIKTNEDNLEAKLMENAKLSFISIDNDESDVNEEDINDEILKLINLLDKNYLKPEEKEIFLQNLLLSSLIKLENCCDNCTNLYDDISNLIKSKTIDEHNEEDLAYSLNEPVANYETLSNFHHVFLQDTNCFDRLNNIYGSINELEGDLSFNDDNKDNLKSIENDSCEKKTNSETEINQNFLTEKKIKRNNSFMEAINDLSDSNNTDPDAPKRNLIIRSSTNNSNDFNFIKPNFKRPSLNLNEESNFRRKYLDKANNVFSLSNIHDSRKRKMPFEFESVSSESINQINFNLNQNFLPPSKSISTTNISSLNFSKKFLPSASLTSLDSLYSQAKFENLLKQNNMCNLSLEELTCFIRNGLYKNQKNENDKKTNEFDFNLTSEIDSEVFCFVIKSFQLVALMLPPSNKRKLHFLLRFLNKLKFNKQSAEYLLNSRFMNDFNFDLNSETNEISLNMTNNNPIKQCYKKDFETKTNALESVIINSFVNSVVRLKLDDVNELDAGLNKKIYSKLFQVLINNYSEIMKIPEELISSIKQKANMNTNMLSSKVKLPETEHLKQHNLTTIESSSNLKKSKKINQNTTNQENIKIKKALNVLGLNDSISYMDMNRKLNVKSNFSGSNLDKLYQTTLNTTTTCTSSNSTQLNQTTMSLFPNSSKNSLFQNTTTINFPKFFANKKSKKENLI